MSARLAELLKLVNGVAPSSDVYDSDPATDVVFFKNYDRIMFVLIQKTAGSNTGTATVTLEKCDDATPTTATAVAFTYWKNEAAATADTFTKATATTAGFTTTANKTAIYIVEAKASDMGDGFPACRLQLTEAVDDPVIGCVLAICGDARYPGDSLPTAIA